MEITIYADVLFGFNYFMNLLILFLTTVLSRIRIKFGRLSLVTAFLALYSVLCFMTEYSFPSSVLGKIIVSSVAVFLISFPTKLQAFLKTLCFFYLVSLTFGGGVYALTMYSKIGILLGAVASGGIVYFNISPIALAGGIFVSYISIFLFKRACMRNFSRDTLLIPLEIQICGKVYRITVLADTGCELTAPITGEGVVLLSHSVLPAENIPTDFHLSISTAGGDTSAKVFFPDDVICLNKNYELAEIPLIAVAPYEFSNDNLYCGVLNPKIIQEININGGTKNEKGKKLSAKSSVLSSGKATTSFKEKGALHRRKRHPASATYQSGGEYSSSSVGYTGITTDCKTNTDRKEFATCCIHSKKV